MLVTPSTSIIIPSWNRKNYLSRTVVSAQDQSEPVVIYVFDDASTDGTASIQLSNDVQRYVAPERVGQCAARNHWFGSVTTEFVKWIDSDDILNSRDALATQVAYLGSHPELDFCWGITDLFSQQYKRQFAGLPTDRPVEDFIVPDDFVGGPSATKVFTAKVQIGCVLFRTQALRDKGPTWDETFKAGSADRKFMSDVARAGLKGQSTEDRVLLHTLDSPNPEQGKGRYWN